MHAAHTRIHQRQENGTQLFSSMIGNDAQLDTMVSQTDITQFIRPDRVLHANKTAAD
jgi:hypothetical protein